MNIRHTLAATFLAAGLGLAGTAQALPVGAGAPVFNDNTGIQEAAYGCGPGMTRGPYGHCRPKFTCPPGWHPGPAGFHCFRNHPPRWRHW